MWINVYKTSYGTRIIGERYKTKETAYKNKSRDFKYEDTVEMPDNLLNSEILKLLEANSTTGDEAKV